MTTEDPKQIRANNQERIIDFMSEAEQIHYFRLCKPDHSDCPLPKGMCMIRDYPEEHKKVVALRGISGKGTR